MIGEVDAQEVARRLETGEGIVIDTLSRHSYDAHHIPGAGHVSYRKEYSAKDTKNGKMVDIETVFLRTFKEQFGDDLSIPIVTYSGSRGCGLSYMGAMCLLRAGYTNISCYRGGLRDWKQHGKSFA